MPPMRDAAALARQFAAQLSLYRAGALSLAIHLLILLLPHSEPPREFTLPGPLHARLQQRRAQPATPPAEVTPPPTPARDGRRQKNSERRLMHVAPSADTAPTWTVAQKAEMDHFLDELAQTARQAPPPPSLAQRALREAHDIGRQMARQEDAAEALLERRPDAPPPNPFSLELYLEGMLRRLNRSASFVHNDPRRNGVQVAAVQFRLNPDGTLKSFVVLNSADQGEQIAFIRTVVERAAPFSAFPPDLDRAARSIGITICIRPGSGGGDPGFTRMANGRCL